MDCAWKPANRSVAGTKFRRRASRFFSPLFRPRSFILFVYADFDSWQEGIELLAHAAHQVLAVDAHHVMAMVEFFEHAVQLAVWSFGKADAEDVSHLVGGQAKQSHFARVLKKSCGWENSV